MKILLIGGNGQVGWELRRTLKAAGEVIAPDRKQLDLSQPETLREIILNIEPNWIVNAAAYTAVDRAEQERDLAFTVNAETPRVLAEISAELDVGLIHYSTDYVFNGTGQIPFDEEAPISPLNVYGASKSAGETAIRAAHPKHLIFRTSWVYGHRGTNFFLTMQRLMREQNELRIIKDQIGAPTWSHHIAEMTALIMRQMSSSPQKSNHSQLWGTYNLTSDGETSWFGFAEAILEVMALERKPALVPISSSDYPLPALRPMNSRLSNEKLQRVFGLKLPNWRLAFNQMIEKS
jgi:dTDP-4-dehydrorhamnose reductase